MDLGLEGRVALVAASSQGLGKACAKTLAREGARVVINGRRGEILEQTRNEIVQETGSEVHAVKADLTKPADIEHLVGETVSRFGRVDILITNSGPPPKGDPMKLTDDDWNHAFNLIFMSTLRLCRAALPYMEKQGWGRVISITSTSVKQPIDGLYLSSITRIPILPLFKILSNRYSSKGISFNIVCPGPFLTEGERKMFEKMAKEQGITYEEAMERFIKGDIPMGRIGNPEELADMVAFLASERASYITGTVVQVDGGRVQCFV